MDGEISRIRAAGRARGLHRGWFDRSRRGIPDRGSTLARRGCVCAPAAHHCVRRPPRRTAGRSRYRADPVRRLGAGDAHPETILESLPELHRADGRSHRERDHQTLQGKAAHVCGRGPFRLVQACGMDPKITHRTIAAAGIDPAAQRNPDREWCEAKPRVLCIESRYELEGKLPSGIRVANQLVDKKKKIDDFLRFQSELRLLSPAELDQPGLGKLTGIGAPIVGAIEQNIFFVNQVMQFGKFLALLQPDATDASKTIVSAFIALAIKTRVIENKNKYANVPVLRNLVPGQVLLGKSSFNTGNSLSAGLPSYARNEIKSVAGILDQE